MYADRVTDSMQLAIDETYRRRRIQAEYNEEHDITPIGIVKGIRDLSDQVRRVAEEKAVYEPIPDLPKDEMNRLVKDLEGQMRRASKDLEFERAAAIRDQITELRRHMEGAGV
jgi:excinuclease ABC subunit B